MECALSFPFSKANTNIVTPWKLESTETVLGTDFEVFINIISW